MTFLTYREAFDRFDGGVRQVVGPQATAGIFATYPQAFLSLAGGFVDQVVGTALLMLLIFALGDGRNFAPEARFGPVLVGAAVVLIGMTLRLQRRVRDQPRARPGPAPVHARRRLGRRRLPRRQRLVVGADRGAAASAPCWAATCTTR